MNKRAGQRRTAPHLRYRAGRMPSSSVPYRVTMTESAKRTYLELRKRSRAAEAKGESTNQHCTTFRMVDDAIRHLIPIDPINKSHALHKPFSDFFRIAKGRLRIVWAADSSHREILIVFISNMPRKEGSVTDPYVILHALLRKGHLDSAVKDWRIALEIPTRKMN